jgi:AraC family transcriptional regulator of adaptative response / DNA-3-methyladenine glycosylase II
MNTVQHEFPGLSSIDTRQCYQAVLAKDSRFDGVFFTGVTSTGIYCRPICSVKPPKASSCQFYHSAAAAEAAGFRPCLRCRPELAPYAIQQNLAYAIWQKIADGALNEQTLDAFAADVGLSSRQIRRLLLQQFGVTPVELAQTQRLLFAKKLLQETQLPMAEIAYAAGFGSVRRFNALFSERYQLAPGAIRRSHLPPQAAITLRLAYRPPYAWPAMMSYLAGRAMPGLEAVQTVGDQQVYVRSIRLDGHSGWLKVSCQPHKAQLQLEIAPALSPVLLTLISRVREQFDLDASPLSIQAHLEADLALKPVLQAVPGLRVPGCFDAFELALRAVLGQQVSVAGATTISGRLVHALGEPADTPFSAVTHHFPTPQRVLQASVSELASLGMPAKRAATLQEIAGFALAQGLHKKPADSLAGFVAAITALPGIGAWTAHYIAMRAMRFPDAFPAGDLGLQKAAARLAGQPDGRYTEAQLLQQAAAWSPWRAYGALLLWHSLSQT